VNTIIILEQGWDPRSAIKLVNNMCLLKLKIRKSLNKKPTTLAVTSHCAYDQVQKFCNWARRSRAPDGQS
jgi:hypothetical protein